MPHLAALWKVPKVHSRHAWKRSGRYEFSKVCSREEANEGASIISVPPATFVSYAKGNLVRDDLLSSLTGARRPAAAKTEKWWTCASSPTFTWGDADNGEVGVTITNADFDWRAFYIYQNLCDYVPLKYLWIAAQHTVFVSLPADFQGR